MPVVTNWGERWRKAAVSATSGALGSGMVRGRMTPISTHPTSLAGYVLGPSGFLRGRAAVAGGRIAQIEGEAVATARVRDGREPIIVPGFVDLHVHGGAGRDIMEGADAAPRVAEVHAAHGTTAMLATTMTAPAADLDVAFAGLADAARGAGRPRAKILGVHLEGPYINEGQLGAQPPFARPVARGELARLNAAFPIRLVTLAPEVPGNLEAISELRAAGCRVQIGHSLATYEETLAAIERGATGFTHLFNAMTAMHHRRPGVVGAALAHGEYAELICDLLHVHPGAIKAALRAIPRAFCVTDSTSAAGMPDGDYKLGRHTVTKCMGGVRLADGTLAGSSLTMDQALRNLVDTIGLDLVDAAKRVSTYAADYLGVTDRGRLDVGTFADAVVLDRDLRVIDVILEGQSLGAGAA